MLTIDSLRAFGANTDEGVERCFGNADFYLNLVKKVPCEKSFDKLAEAIEKKDLDSAFEYAHALKGVLANLSLTPVLDPVVEITEMLRARKDEDYSELMERIMNAKAELTKIAEE